jgi:predicted dithiol-disulfide oxidoreductase (DUF899 family)
MEGVSRDKWLEARRDLLAAEKDLTRRSDKVAQLQHFMLTPGAEQGCPSCSYMADHTDGMIPHLAHRDVTFIMAPDSKTSSKYLRG